MEIEEKNLLTESGFFFSLEMEREEKEKKKIIKFK